jgi:sulfopyruvate decarboxylase subunit beta
VAAVNKTAAIRAVLAATTDDPVVFTTGYACRIARDIADRPGHFYMTGSMGLASSIGVGVALATGRRTVVVDGDGSLLMNPVGPVTAGALPGLPLVHVVLDDGRYASTGGQSVPSARTDLAALAGAAGYPRVTTADRLDAFDRDLRAALAAPDTPAFVLAVLTEPDPPVPPRIDADLAGHARRFAAHLAGRRRAIPSPEGSGQ